MRIIARLGYGAAYQIAPCVFHELGADVVSIGASPDGFNINVVSVRRIRSTAEPKVKSCKASRHRA